MSNVIFKDFFEYKGVKYTKGTRIEFTWDFNQRLIKHNISKLPNADVAMRSNPYINNPCYTPAPSYFHYIRYIDGQEDWVCGFLAGTGMKIDPDKDIERVINPVLYYYPPLPSTTMKEYVKEGTWMNKFGWPTVLYGLSLLVGSIFKERLLIYIVSTCVFLYSMFKQTLE